MLVCFKKNVDLYKSFTSYNTMKTGKSYYFILVIVYFIISVFPLESKTLSNFYSSAPSWKNIVLEGKKVTVFCIYTDNSGLVWLGTNSGLYFYDGVSAKSVCEKEMFGVQIYSIKEKDNCIYLGSNNGLLLYDLKSGKLENIQNKLPTEIRSMLLEDDILWVGSLFGFYKYNIKNNEVIDCSNGLNHKSVYSILRDSRGILYAGTYSGLARWDSDKNKFQQIKFSIEGEKIKEIFVNSILESENKTTIYIGSEGSLYEYSPINEQWMKVSGLEGNVIKSLALTSNGHLLVGSDNGVFDLYKNSLHHYRHDSRHEQTISDNEIWCIYSDNNDNIWIGHQKGISIAANTNTIKTTKLSAIFNTGDGNEIYSIFKDSNSNLWMGGTNGVIRLSENKAPKWYLHSNNAKSLSHNRIRSIDEDAEGNIWLSSDKGLNRYNQISDNFDVFHIVDNNGRHNTNWVYSLEEDGANFWVGSYLGGLHYISKSKFKGAGGTVIADQSINVDNKKFNNIDVNLKNDFVSNVVRDSKGNIWVLLFRDNSLIKLSPDDGCIEYDIFKITGGYPSYITTDSKDRLWCAFNGGAIMFDNDKYHVVKFQNTDEDNVVLAIGKVGNDIWISTQSNVWKIDGNKLTASILPIPQKYYTSLYEDVTSDKVYLGGTDEFVEVCLNELKNDSEFRSVKMVLVDKGDGYFDFSTINDSPNLLNLSYGGSVSLIISTLDYSPEFIQHFAYKLVKHNSKTEGNWIVMPEGANTITLSNLSMGDYKLLIKTIDSSIVSTVISLKVDYPWFLSWWAICIYCIIILLSVISIIWYAHKRNMKKMLIEERKKSLENAEKKLTFLSNISHDLKTPLSMILGPVSILKEKIEDKENKKSLEVIYSNAIKLNNMIHCTLELQHLEDVDENLLILSTFDVVGFCNNIFESFKENNLNKKFIFHTSCDQLIIEADAVKLESVMTNLLSNACKYSEDNSTISCGISMKGNNVEIVVSDDGIGIAESDKQLVFQRMFRSPSTSKLYEGTGIGLYLIKKYLELMKGNIEMFSHKGHGTSFFVTLPLSNNIVSNQNSLSIEAKDGNNPKILIVEDNPQISMFISELLKNDYTLMLAENGRVGLSLASSFIPDLIIVDEKMPIMSGTEMISLLKQNPRLNLIPIIMLTAQSDNRTENKSVQLGVDAFMSKPFEPSILLGRINHLIKLKREIIESERLRTFTEVKPIEAESVLEKQIAKIARIIEENISDPDLNVNLLCEKSSIPNKQLYRIIKKHIGMAPLDYIRLVRLQKAAMLLEQNRFTVSEVSYMVGFNTPSYFAKCFQKQYGIKPSEYEFKDGLIK